MTTRLVPVTLSSILLSGIASAQSAAPPAAPPGMAPAAGAASDGSAWMILGIIAAFLVALAMAVKIFDARRRRSDEAVALQSRLADALMTDPSLKSATVTPTVHVPISRGSAVIVEVSGDVPSPELRDIVLRKVRQEVSDLLPRVQIEDKLLVLPPISSRVA